MYVHATAIFSGNECLEENGKVNRNTLTENTTPVIFLIRA